MEDLYFRSLFCLSAAVIDLSVVTGPRLLRVTPGLDQRFRVTQFLQWDLGKD